MSYTSKLPRIALELGVRMDTASKAVAEAVEEVAKERVPVNEGDLKDAIHVEREGVGEHFVIAGDTEVFYGHLVEYGTSHSGPRAFMTPAAEQVRPLAQTMGNRALKGLG